MTPAEVLRRAVDHLARHHVESPLPTAELLLASALGTDRAGVYTRSGGITAQEAKRFGRLLRRRLAGTPVQHLTGEQGFRRLTLLIRGGVFVPRPETEIVVEVALRSIEDTRAPVAADVGTGAGAIALAIADERPDARVLATDLAPEAAELARENAARLGLAVEVLEGDLLAPLPGDLHAGVDLVVSNPPYVTTDEYPGLPADVLADPRMALIGGIRFYERLLPEATRWLRPGGAVVVEIGASQGAELADVARAAGLVDVHVLPDLCGRDRVLAGRIR